MSESHTIGIVVVLVRHCPCALCQGGAGGRSDGRRSALPVTQLSHSRLKSSAECFLDPRASCTVHKRAVRDPGLSIPRICDHRPRDPRITPSRSVPRGAPRRAWVSSLGLTPLATEVSCEVPVLPRNEQGSP